MIITTLPTRLLRYHPPLVRGVLIALTLMGGDPASAGNQPPAHLKEHPITIDATSLVPTSWWQVPGVTPSIWASDPESLDAPKTSERRQLSLKPGQYKFISFTFDFPFTVTLEGTLDFSHSLDQCVGGRGTQTLVVRCKRMYPHGGERDPYYSQTP
ncbi:MAG: hypothetical protein NNA23_01925 [Nitrospira sp.]|nr:hypothetical protein [Nitrospira sp.]MCP9464148.1 hypothetical protein [Nitrospira sp.]